MRTGMEEDRGFHVVSDASTDSARSGEGGGQMPRHIVIHRSCLTWADTIVYVCPPLRGTHGAIPRVYTSKFHEIDLDLRAGEVVSLRSFP